MRSHFRVTNRDALERRLFDVLGWNIYNKYTVKIKKYSSVWLN